MAHHASHTPYLTQEQKNELKKKLEISNFDINAIVRGAQLTVVGGRHGVFMLSIATLIPA